MKNIKQFAYRQVLYILLVINGLSSCDTIEKDTKQHPERVKISFISNYNPFPPAFAKLSIYSPTVVNSIDLMSTGNVYEFSLSENEDCTFNIETNNVAICGHDPNEWVASKSGIRAKEIKVNNKVLNNEFLIDNEVGGANFCFRIDNDGNIVPGGGEKVIVNENIPAEVSYSKQTVHLNNPTEFANKFANAWFSALQDIHKGGISKIEIETLNLYARLTNGQDILIASDNYETQWGGKLYIRYPYFECPLKEDLQLDMPAQIIDGKLTFAPSENANRIWHGWCTGSWKQVPSNAIKLWIEADIRITGNALIQFGVDLSYSNSVESWCCEYGLSDWSFQSANFQKVYFNKP